MINFANFPSTAAPNLLLRLQLITAATAVQVLVGEHRSKKNSHRNQAVLPAKLANVRGRTSEAMTRSLGALGIDASKAVARARSQSRGRKRDRSVSKAQDGSSKGGDVDMVEGGDQAKKRVHSSKSR